MQTVFFRIKFRLTFLFLKFIYIVTLNSHEKLSSEFGYFLSRLSLSEPRTNYSKLYKIIV